MNLANLLFRRNGTISRLQFIITFGIATLLFLIIGSYIFLFLLAPTFAKGQIDPIVLSVSFLGFFFIFATSLFIHLNIVTKRLRGLGKPEETLHWRKLIFKPGSPALFFQPDDTFLRKVGVISSIIIPFFILFNYAFNNIIIPHGNLLFNSHPSVIAAKKYLQEKDLSSYGTGLIFSMKNVSIKDAGNAESASVEFSISGSIKKDYETVHLSKSGSVWSVE